VAAINLARIKEARLRKGLTLEKAAGGMDISLSWLSEIERGRKISTKVLQRLATNYGLPMSYFLSRQNEQSIEILPQGRKQRISETIQRRLLLIIRDNYELIEKLEKDTKTEWQSEALSVWSGNEQTAIKVRSRFCPDAINLDSVTEILERSGILVIEIRAESQENGKRNIADGEAGREVEPEFESLVLKIGERYVVGIADDLESIAKRRALAEGLGIVLLHNSAELFSQDKVSSFARYLLLPVELLKKYFPPDGFLTMNMLELMRLFFGLSRRSILEHLREAGMIQESKVRYWVGKLNKAETLPAVPYTCHEQSRYYWRLLSRAALEHNISYARTEEILSLFTN